MAPAAKWQRLGQPRAPAAAGASPAPAAAGASPAPVAAPQALAPTHQKWVAAFYKWLRKHQRGEQVTTKQGIPAPMAKLSAAWNKIQRNDNDARREFAEAHLGKLFMRPTGGVKQPEFRSGHDAQSVIRSVVIMKTFKLEDKLETTRKALEKTAGCFCTPELFGTCPITKRLVMQDCGDNLHELGVNLKADKQVGLMSHFKAVHNIIVHPCQVSAKNVCIRPDGRPPLVD